MRSNRGGPPSAKSSADPQHPKLTVTGRAADGTLKLQVKVPGLFHRFTLPRGSDERPLQFDGELVAEAETQSGQAVLRAAVYRTKGEQYVTEFSKQEQNQEATGKAGVFDTLDEAVSWFRPGKLTVALLKQLGRWEAQPLDENASAGADAMPSTSELLTLLALPNESLSAEYKSWLDFGDTRGRATLAKAAIALANSGGGVIVLGMREQETAGQLQSVPRPPDIDRYTQDDVNQAINRFAEPEFHCELSFAVHPATRIEHAFVSVPGDMAVPVMSRRDCEGVIQARRCYVRKPGPRSEEPFEGQEWRDLLDRCVRAGRENMLESIRSIVQGRAGGRPQAALVGEALREFAETAQSRWDGLVKGLPADDPARFPHGYYELAFEFLNAKPLASLTVLRTAMKEASAVKHTGWGPFVQLTRSEFEPRIVAGAIEAWLGLPAERLLGRPPHHCDFWRADSSGKLVLLRGYDEDGLSNREPGRWIDVTMPVWRVGEAILYVGRLAEAFGEDTSLLVRCRFTGLRGRVLTSIEGRRMMFDERRSADNEVSLERQITVNQARDNLVEVLHPLLSPLYESFGFFELSEKLVAEEVVRMTQNRF